MNVNTQVLIEFFSFCLIQNRMWEFSNASENFFYLDQNQLNKSRNVIHKQNELGIKMPKILKIKSRIKHGSYYDQNGISTTMVQTMLGRSNIRL